MHTGIGRAAERRDEKEEEGVGKEEEKEKEQQHEPSPRSGLPILPPSLPAHMLIKTTTHYGSPESRLLTAKKFTVALRCPELALIGSIRPKVATQQSL